MKTPLLLLLLLVFLLVLGRAAVSQTFLDYYCYNTGNYTDFSKYQNNLNRLLLRGLYGQGQLSGFYNGTLGEPPDTVYGLFLCRGDVSADTCQNCINNATVEILQECPSNNCSFCPRVESPLVARGQEPWAWASPQQSPGSSGSQLLRQSSERRNGSPSQGQSTPPSTRTPMMAAMHEDESQDLNEVDWILSEILEVPEVHPRIRKLVVKVCDVVTRRAARLAASGIVGILKKIGRDGERSFGNRSRPDALMRRVVVAVEGDLYTSYTMFREYLHEALGEILGEDIARHVVLQEVDDGSGIGAALVAAAHSSNLVHTQEQKLFF